MKGEQFIEVVEEALDSLPQEFRNEHLGADGSFQAARSEIEHGVDLLAGYVELLHDFFDGQTVFEILEDSCDGQASAAENPGAAHFAGDAFHSRAS